VPSEAVKLVAEPRAGLVVHSERGVSVGLDTVLDEELRREGLARELVNRIQRLRKDAGLELDDRIRLGIFGTQEIASAAEAHRDYIATEVLAVEVEITVDRPRSGGYEHLREIKLDGNEALIGVDVR
jgi:isoleucyl-tRNA synthetase